MDADLDVQSLELMMAAAMRERAATLERRYQLLHDNEELHRRQVEARRVGKRLVRVSRRVPVQRR